MHNLVLVSELKDFALSYVAFSVSVAMSRWFRRRQTVPSDATLSLLCVSGAIRPVMLMMLGLQKHRLGIVHRSWGPVGPLLSCMV